MNNVIDDATVFPVLISDRFTTKIQLFPTSTAVDVVFGGIFALLTLHCECGADLH